MSARRTSPAEVRLRAGESLHIPREARELVVRCGRKSLTLTNLHKVFFPEAGLTKRDLLQYYADVAPALLPHLSGRAMVMKRFPNGIHGKFFFMKRTPAGAPPWIECCTIEHASGNVIDFPIANDLPSLLWLVSISSGPEMQMTSCRCRTSGASDASYSSSFWTRWIIARVS